MSDAPATLEGWFVSHDRWTIDWRRWRAVPKAQREAAVKELTSALHAIATTGVGRGDSAVYGVLGQKGDLCFLHFRDSLGALKEAEFAVRNLAIADYLLPAGAYLSVIEVGLYEATAMAQRKLAERGLTTAAPEWDAAFAAEMATQTSRLETRLRPVIPSSAWLCFYPMNKRRGEQDNWYALDAEARRILMRGHGKVGHRYHGQVTQIIGGSIALDDWEWGVSLFADDPVTFKKLVTEMRYDPASSRYAEFGPFVVGRRLLIADLPDFFAGSLPA